MADIESIPDGIALLSLHEVTPVFEDDVVHSCDLFDELGITSYTMLVTPFYQLKRANTFERHDTFAEYLLAMGQELSLHGYSHISKSGSLDEFKRMPLDRLRSRVKSATSMFVQSFDTHPVGFIPPLWVAPQKLVQFTKANRMNYCVIGNRIMPTSSDIIFETVDMVISRGGSKVNLGTSLVELELGGPVQIAVHPLDHRNNNMFDLLADLKDRLGYTFMGYWDFLRSKLSDGIQQ